MPTTLDDIMNSHRTGQDIVMGILNVTPDSFSDGGEFLDAAAAIAHARKMLDDGADIIDIGAESTRPGSDRVSEQQQIIRIQSVLPAIAASGAIISVDTTLASVAEMAIHHGASIINDVSAGRDDADMLPLAGASHTPIVLMHMLGKPKSMQQDPTYENVVAEVSEFLAERIAIAAASGVEPENIILDPGIGFGKRLEHNLELIRKVKELAGFGCPVMIGPSRKRFIGELTGKKSPTNRLGGTISACLAARKGGASIFRIHDVAEVRDALTVAASLN